MTAAGVELRQASLADADFIYRLVEVTMRSCVEETWGSFSDELNRQNIAETIAAKNYSIIQCRGEDVGAISVERHPDFIKLSQLRVLKNNPARRLYERLGFRVSSITPERVYMELNA
jgi:hypothetical protein